MLTPNKPNAAPQITESTSKGNLSVRPDGPRPPALAKPEGLLVAMPVPVLPALVNNRPDGIRPAALPKPEGVQANPGAPFAWPLMPRESSTVSEDLSPPTSEEESCAD